MKPLDYVLSDKSDRPYSQLYNYYNYHTKITMISNTGTLLSGTRTRLCWYGLILTRIRLYFYG